MISSFFEQKLVCFCMLLFAVSVGHAQGVRHDLIQTFEHEHLSNVVQLESTADGKHLYSAGHTPGYVLRFDCDAVTGELSKTNSMLKYKVLSVDVNQKLKRVVICCNMGRGKVTLYNQAEDTAELVYSDEIYQDNFAGLKSNTAVEFSVDANQVYVVTSENRLLVLENKDGKLSLLQEHSGENNGLGVCRDLARSPSGDYVFISSSEPGIIAMYRREDDGRLRLCSFIEDDSLQAALLAGVHGIVVSPDEKHLYAVSGRSKGDNGVSGFRITDEATLEKICEFENGVELEGFDGGSFIRVSPDGKFVYASATRSEKVACFRRDVDSGNLQFQGYLNVNGIEELGKTAAIAFSRGGEFVYVAIESQGRILAFKRSEGSN